MKTEIINGKLVITVDMDKKGTLSSSEKSLIHASSHGNQPTSLQVGGKPLIVGLNCYTKV